MSWSLTITNDGTGCGDLEVSGAQLGVVRGRDKLIQDFRCALMESLGNDDMQPLWGSTLEGGVTPDGRMVEGIIGGSDPTIAANAIENEIRRIATVLQQRQLTRVQTERLTYNKVTLTASEILVGVTHVRVLQAGDELTVLVTLQTGANDLVDVSVPLSSDSLVAT
jgi:hypothetical protein